jgi:nucleoside 2-deoxyribosyltransferase
MKIYLAGPWKHRTTAKDVAQQLRDAGHKITSRWHDIWALLEESHDPLVMEQEADCDLSDVESADIVVVLNIEKSEGKAVEQGFALGLGIPIVVIGAHSNVFHWLPEVTVVKDLEDAIAYLMTGV